MIAPQKISEVFALRRTANNKLEELIHEFNTQNTGEVGAPPAVPAADEEAYSPSSPSGGMQSAVVPTSPPPLVSAAKEAADWLTSLVEEEEVYAVEVQPLIRRLTSAIEGHNNERNRFTPIEQNGWQFHFKKLHGLLSHAQMDAPAETLTAITEQLLLLEARANG